MIRYKIILFIILFAATTCSAQISKINNIGLQFGLGFNPELKMLNYKTDKLRLTDLKGKLVIIDFWATWCAPCRDFLITADSLKKKFGEKLVILPVTYEDSTVAATYLSSFQKFTGINTFTVINDAALMQVFSHNSIPHEIWISPDDQKVIAITGAEDVNAVNIQRVLNHEEVNLPLKEDYPRFIIDNKKTVIFDENQIKVPKAAILRKVDNAKYRFILTKELLGLPSEILFGNDDTIHNFNSSILGLYLYLNGTEPGASNMGHIVVKVKDKSNIDWPEKMNYGDKMKWAINNTYCFEFLKKDTSLNSYAVVRTELNNYFKDLNIRGEWETKDVPCYVLKRSSNIDKVKSAGGEKKEVINAYTLSFRNASFYDWTFKLKTYFLQESLPIIDESGFQDENVDMELVCKMTDINSINIALAKYDLKFVKEVKKQRFMVLKNVN